MYGVLSICPSLIHIKTLHMRTHAFLLNKTMKLHLLQEQPCKKDIAFNIGLAQVCICHAIMQSISLTKQHQRRLPIQHKYSHFISIKICRDVHIYTGGIESHKIANYYIGRHDMNGHWLLARNLHRFCLGPPCGHTALPPVPPPQKPHLHFHDHTVISNHHRPHVASSMFSAHFMPWPESVKKNSENIFETRLPKEIRGKASEVVKSQQLISYLCPGIKHLSDLVYPLLWLWLSGMFFNAWVHNTALVVNL